MNDVIKTGVERKKKEVIYSSLKKLLNEFEDEAPNSKLQLLLIHFLRYDPILLFSHTTHNPISKCYHAHFVYGRSRHIVGGILDFRLDHLLRRLQLSPISHMKAVQKMC
jgi:hypothetical protein